MTQFQVPEQLPHSADGERAILGAILIDNSLMAQAAEMLEVDSFYVESHKKIFGAMKGLHHAGSEINPIYVAEALRQDGQLHFVGGVGDIAALTVGMPRIDKLDSYAKLVKGKQLLRDIIRTAYHMIAEAEVQEDEPEIVLNHAQQAVFELGTSTSMRRAQSLKEVTRAASDVVKGFVRGINPGLATPWTELDNLCRGGIQESELWGLAALAKSGKSAVMKQWAQKLGREGRRVLIFTREMSEIKILFRMLSALTYIPASQIRYGLDENRVVKLLGAMAEVQDYPIFIDATTSNIKDFRARVREMIRLEGIEIVFADYLQLFHSGLKTDNRATEVGHVWRTMKDTAQDFNTRVVALAQFNREAYKSDKRPYFHQVEGSGEGEKAVDVGMVLWTDLNSGEPGARPSTIHIDYQRDEDAGTEVALEFNGRIMEFTSDSQRLSFNAGL